MKTIPNSIKNKLESYVNHTQYAEKLRNEIEKWFLSNGINTDVDSGDLTGAIITDIIIDTGLDGNIDEAIFLMEKTLNKIEEG